MTRYLHVLNGHSFFSGFRKTEIPGKVVIWADALYEGPISNDVSPEAWRQVRAHYYGSMGTATIARSLLAHEDRDAQLERFSDYDEVIIWLGHDLFDQLLLIRHLDWFTRRELGDTRLSLICIDRFPGVDRFKGLGMLPPRMIATLFGSQTPVSPEQFRLGRSAWAAFCSPDPREIEVVLGGDTSPLPFLSAALRRHLSEFPSTRNGLSRAESDALAEMREVPAKPARICGDWLARNDDAWMADDTFFALLRKLARGTKPLIEPIRPIDPENNVDFNRTEHRLTSLGRKVVAGEADRVADCGIDRHLGGVYLIGHEIAWRWDAEAGRIA